MRRALKLFRAEAVRSVLLTIRYPIELFVGLFIMYMLFMGLFLGARSLVGDPQVLSASLDGFIISYVMWFFVISAIGRLAFHIESEAQMGVLEQIFLTYPRMLSLMLIRSAVDFCTSLLVVTVLLLSIMATTGKWLAIGTGNILQILVLLVITVAGIYGFGLIFAGLALVFKRIGQIGSIMQFAFFFLAYFPVEQLTGWLKVALYSLPLTLGVNLIKTVVVEHGSVFGGPKPWLLLCLVINSVAYLLVGSVVFLICERKSRMDGRLGQY